jgi:DNA polymerase III epsilon subunit-like protein
VYNIGNKNKYYMQNDAKHRLNEVHSIKVPAGSRTYFLNLKQDRKGTFYMILKESKRVDEYNFESHRIVMYEEDFENFMEAFKEIMRFVEQHRD